MISYYNIKFKSKNRMITNPKFLKPKEKPYFHKNSLDCIEKLVDSLERLNKGKLTEKMLWEFIFLEKMLKIVTIYTSTIFVIQILL